MYGLLYLHDPASLGPKTNSLDNGTRTNNRVGPASKVYCLVGHNFGPYPPWDGAFKDAQAQRVSLNIKETLIVD